jgi:hypothetical protein
MTANLKIAEERRLSLEVPLRGALGLCGNRKIVILAKMISYPAPASLAGLDHFLLRWPGVIGILESAKRLALVEPEIVITSDPTPRSKTPSRRQHVVKLQQGVVLQSLAIGY